MANRYWVGGSGTWDASNTTNWSATSGGSGGASVPGASDAVFIDNNSGTGTITLDYSPTVQSIILSGSTTRTVDFGANTVTLNGVNGLNYLFAINLTVSASSASFDVTSVLRVNGTFVCSSLIFRTANSNTTNDIRGNITTTTFEIIGQAPFTTPYRDILEIDNTITVTGNLTATGSAQRPLTLFGIRGTSTINVSGTVSLTDVNLHHMTCGGTWAGTRVGDAGGNTGSITFDASRNLYWIGNGGNWQDNSKWSTSSGGASATTYPLPQDICHFDANSFSTSNQEVMINSYWTPAMDWTGVTNNPKLDYFFPTLFCGSFYTFNSNFTGDDFNWINLSTPVGGTMTLTSNGFDWNSLSRNYLEINNQQYNGDIGGTIVFADDFNAPNTYLYSAGGSYLIQINNGADVTLDDWDFDGNGTSNNTHVINGNLFINNEFYDTGAGSVIYSGTGAIYLQGNLSAHDFVFSTVLTTSEFQLPLIIDNDTFNDISTNAIINEITSTSSYSPIIRFRSNVSVNTFSVNTATLRSSVSGTPRTLTIGSADIKRATISDITSATPITVRNSVDAGNNTNINFIEVPVNENTTQSSIINSNTTGVTVTNL